MFLFAVTGFEVLFGVGIVVGLLALFQRKTLSRFGAAIGGQTGKLGRLIWGFDPIAVYQQQLDDSAEDIKHGTAGLEQYSGLVARFKRQVEIKQKEVNIYDARATLHAQNGKDKEASDALIAKKKAEKELADNEHQLTVYQTAYDNNLKKIKVAQERVQRAREEAAKLQADLNMSVVEAETAKLAQSFNFDGGNFNQITEVKDEIQRQIDNNRAKAQVASDLSNDGLAEVEAEELLRQSEAAEDLKKLKERLGKV